MENDVVHPLSTVTNSLIMHLIPICIKHVFWLGFIPFNGIIKVLTIENILYLWSLNQQISMVEFDHGSVLCVVLYLN